MSWTDQRESGEETGEESPSERGDSGEVGEEAGEDMGDTFAEYGRVRFNIREMLGSELG